MKKSTKVLLGIATIWPVLYMFLFMGVFMVSMFLRGGEPGAIWAIIIPLHLLTMLGIIGLITFYMVNVFRNDRVSKDMKVLWAVVLFMGSPVAMPIYWYLYIWRGTPDTTSQKPPQLGAGLQSRWRSQTAAPEREAAYVPPSQPPDWR